MRWSVAWKSSSLENTPRMCKQWSFLKMYSTYWIFLRLVLVSRFCLFPKNFRSLRKYNSTWWYSLDTTVTCYDPVSFNIALALLVRLEGVQTALATILEQWPSLPTFEAWCGISPCVFNKRRYYNFIVGQKLSVLIATLENGYQRFNGNISKFPATFLPGCIKSQMLQFFL